MSWTIEESEPPKNHGAGEARMQLQPQRFRRAGSTAFGVAGVVLLAGAALWPSQAARVFHSSWFAALVGAWCCGSAMLLHPRISAGLAQGFREFRKATDQVTHEIRGDNDDDDGPPAT